MSVRTTQIVAVVAVLLGAAGVAVGVSAKTGTKSDEEIADSVKTELSEEVGTTKKQVVAIQARTNARLSSLEGKNETLRKQLDALTETVTKLSSDLTADITRLGTRITELSKRVDRLNNSSAGP